MQEGTLDDELTTWMNQQQYGLGHQAWRGEMLLAGLMALAPPCSRAGSILLPRTFRALESWLNRCPTLSRLP